MGFFNSGVFSSIMAGGTNMMNTILNNRAQAKMQEKNYNNQVELWRMQNEYNKPINVMKRLEEAGLNPNLVYANGATTTAGPVGYTPGVAPQSPFSSIGDAINNYMNYAGQREERLLRKQAIDNLKVKDNATTDIARTEVGIKREQLKEAKLNNELTRQQIVQNMDINKTTLANDVEAHNLNMTIKRKEAKFKDKTRWIDYGIDKLTQVGDTASKFVIPRFTYIRK